MCERGEAAPAAAVVEYAVVLLRARLLTTWEDVERFVQCGGLPQLQDRLSARSAFRVWGAPRSG